MYLYMCLDIYFLKEQKKTTECCRMIELFFLFFYMLRELSQDFMMCTELEPCHIHLLLSFSKNKSAEMRPSMLKSSMCERFPKNSPNTALCEKWKLTQESNWAEIKPL